MAILTKPMCIPGTGVSQGVHSHFHENTHTFTPFGGCCPVARRRRTLPAPCLQNPSPPLVCKPRRKPRHSKTRFLHIRCGSRERFRGRGAKEGCEGGVRRRGAKEGGEGRRAKEGAEEGRVGGGEGGGRRKWAKEVYLAEIAERGPLGGTPFVVQGWLCCCQR
jgi:hypothetical protein